MGVAVFFCLNRDFSKISRINKVNFNGVFGKPLGLPLSVEKMHTPPFCIPLGMR